MTNEELAKEIAKGLIETGIEGGTDAVSCSTAGDYPSIGCSQWEGSRADYLLSCIDGGERFIGRSYSDIEEADELDELALLISSPQGEEAQMELLAQDTLLYVDWLKDIVSLDDSRAFIYAGMWCPTSHVVVCNFLEWFEDEVDYRSLYEIYKLFEYSYADYAQCSEYAYGYANRAETTYHYVAGLNLREYGVQPYDGE